MQKFESSRWYASAIMLLLVATSSILAQSSVPDLMNYQGHLTDASGSPINGTADVKFLVYNGATAGSLLWSEEYPTLQITDGLFSVLLGSVNPFPEYLFDGSDLYLAISVNSDPEMTPRQRIVTAAFAQRVATVDQASGGLITRDVEIDGSLRVGLGSQNPGASATAIGSGCIADGDYATVSGGSLNNASGLESVISGGNNNLVIGDQAAVAGGTNNSAYGAASAIDGGSNNTVYGTLTSIGGGRYNQISDSASAIGGGSWNQISGKYSMIAGGGGDVDSLGNEIIGDGGFIGGGYQNSISMPATGTLFHCAIVGGRKNRISAYGIGSFIGGGDENTVLDGRAVICGGYSNTVSALQSVIGGGYDNDASGTTSTVAGGAQNHAAGSDSFIGGGYNNTIAELASESVVCGGSENTVQGILSVVSGGNKNRATGDYSAILGGFENEAAGTGAVAAGVKANANFDGTFVWADDFGVPFFAAKPNEFAIRPTNGLRSAANNPAYGAIISNDGDGDGIRAIGSSSNGTSWGALYAYNSGSSPAISAIAGAGLAAYFNGDIDVTGTVTKSASFTKTDNPLDPANKYLQQAHVESNEMINVFSGNVITDANGYATITLPDYIEALDRDFRYQLTVIGDFAQAIVAKKINNGSFTLRTSKPDLEVSWQVTGTRNDAVAQQVNFAAEIAKSTEERGKYLNPDAYGLPASAAINNPDEKTQPTESR